RRVLFRSLVLEGAVVVQDLAKRQIARAGDVTARHPGTDLRLFAGEAARAAGVEDLLGAAVEVGEHLRLRADGAHAGRRLHRTFAGGRTAAFERPRSEEHTSELQSREKLVCRL